ncbi:MAG: hypothetical protein L0207_00465 [Chlamydiae bacterium]|nr:hypothetical protein [Chlamydiota bacterium]
MAIQVGFEQFSAQFVHHGVDLNLYTPLEIKRILEVAIVHANYELKEQGVVVFFKEQVPEEKTGSFDPKCNTLLGIKRATEEELIDIIDVKALDEKSIKPVENLKQEIVQKAKQHLFAKKTHGIFISGSGSKFDTRKLTKHTFAIDAKGYMTINDFLITFLINNKYLIIKAAQVRSYIIIRIVEEEGNKVRFVDEYDLVRRNSQGMVIQMGMTHQFTTDCFIEEYREDAKAYNGVYLLLQRDKLTESAKKKLHKVLSTFTYS